MSDSFPGAWYRRYDALVNQADQYLRAYRLLSPSAPQHTEIKAYSDFNVVRMIFESNAIEGAGLPEGATRKLVNEHFPHIPDTYETFRKATSWVESFVSFPELKDLQEAAKEYGKTLNDVELSIGFQKTNRSAMEVLQHQVACLEARSLLAEYRADIIAAQMAGREAELAEHSKKEPELVQDILNRLPSIPRDRLGRPLLFTEERVRKLHSSIAHGLLPPDAGVPAGTYRLDERHVGTDIKFPSPANVPAAMARFVERSNDVLSSDESLYFKAAEISYEFVAIHPFPDFNGRLSRLLLTTVLSNGGIPFPVTIRSAAKGRHRYLSSLRKANRGDLKPYAALIALRVVEQFRELDQNLIRIGFGSLLSPAL